MFLFFINVIIIVIYEFIVIINVIVTVVKIKTIFFKPIFSNKFFFKVRNNFL